MRWAVTGADGMLARDLVDALRAAGEQVTPLRRADLDVTDPSAAVARLAGHDVVVNCAAWTAVDDAEVDESAAFAVNGLGAAVVADAAARTGALGVQISTDYVFDGTADAPYPEHAATTPASAYGRTKAAGERAVRAHLPDRHLILRTAWLYGRHGTCFPRTIARVVADRGGADVVEDQVGQPTWTVDVADLLLRLVRAGAPAGTYHATSAGQCSWFEFAQEVVRSAGGDAQAVRPTTTARFPRPAPRPAYSVLGHAAFDAVGVPGIGDWRERWRVAAGVVLG